MSDSDIVMLVSEGIEGMQKSLLAIKNDNYGQASLLVQVANTKLKKALEMKAQFSNFDIGFEKDEAFRISLYMIGSQIQTVGEVLKVFPVPGGQQLYHHHFECFKLVCDYFDEPCDLSPVF